MNCDLIIKALSQYGVKEIPGKEHNPQIIEYFKVSGHNWVDNDELSWCGAYVNWVAIKCGYEATKKLSARSWLEIGIPVLEIVGDKLVWAERPTLEDLEKGNLPKAKVGDIVVLWRISKDSIYGHVGFYIGDVDDDYIWVLGGNQNNGVNISAYPKSRILGYRRLRKLSQ